VVARELIITGLRSFIETQAASFGADWLGKIKMGLQCAALIGILLVQALRAAGVTDEPWAAVTVALIYAMIAATALSGLQYLWRALLLLRAI
jgi:phosphatidylglycerophosphate synthase